MKNNLFILLYSFYFLLCIKKNNLIYSFMNNLRITTFKFANYSLKVCFL